jgi:hypothetical protein
MRKETGKPAKLLKIRSAVFDDTGSLVVYTPQQWKQEWVALSDYVPSDESHFNEVISDDDVPS